jgi:hypothetical protein
VRISKRRESSGTGASVTIAAFFLIVRARYHSATVGKLITIKAGRLFVLWHSTLELSTTN